MSQVQNPAQTPSPLPQLPRRAILLAAGLGLAAALPPLLKPEQLVAEKSPPVQLERLVPEHFGGWSVDRSLAPLLPSPDVLQKIEQIYDETLARTYVDAQGRRIMLSIAYGGDQSGRLRVHRPEACYSAQGFHVKKLREELVDYGAARVELKRLMARLGPRPEPITYWIRVGKSTVSGNFGQRLVQLQYGINGEIPDGLIFRVSSIDGDADAAYRAHDEFIRALLGALDARGVNVLVGS